MTIITDATVEGVISLAGDIVAQRDLEYEVVVASSLNQDITYTRESNIRLRAGESSVGYNVTGLRRAIGANLFSVSARCTNCFGESKVPRAFSENLSPNENHQDINFQLSVEPPIQAGPIIIAPIVDLLLSPTL